MPARPRTVKKFAVTLIMSVAAFVLLTGQFCPFGGGEQQAPAPPPAPVAPAPVAEAPEPVDEPAGEPAEEPMDAPQIDPSNLEVQTLTLVDSNGNARAVLGTDESGAPAFTLLDANGGSRSRISLDGNGNPFIDLYNSKGDILSSYWIENDVPYLTYRDKDGKTVTIIPKETVAPPRPVPTATNRPVVNRPTTTSTKPLNADYTVYYNSKSRRYHLRSCDQLKKGSNRFPISLQEAVTQGYVPCGDCRPPRLGVPYQGGRTPATGSSSTAGSSASTSSSSSSNSNNNPTVYINSKHRLYHLRSCPELKEGKNKFPIGMQDAKAQGYVPCKRCKPPYF